MYYWWYYVLTPEERLDTAVIAAIFAVLAVSFMIFVFRLRRRS